MRWPILALTLLMIAGGVDAASVRIRLIRASNQKAPDDEKISDIAPTLKTVFGYGHYKQLGTDRGAIQNNKRLRLSPGEGFSAFIRPKGVTENVHEMEVDLYSGRALVTKATVKIAENSSVLIKGPEVGATLIIVSLTVTE